MSPMRISAVRQLPELDETKMQLIDDYAFEIRETCLGEALDQAAERWEGRIGWVFGEEHVSFRQMQKRSDDVAASLLALGIKPGDVVAVWMPNLAEFAYCEFACAKIGAVIAAINTRSKSFELEHVLQHSDARVLVMVDAFLKHDFAGTLAELAPVAERGPDGAVRASRLPHLQRVVSISPKPARGSLNWEEFLALGRNVPAEVLQRRQSERHWGEPVVLQYTSGTTALPKGALCNHRYVLNFGIAFLKPTGLNGEDVFLNTQPFYHVGGSCGALPVPLAEGTKVVSAEYYETETILRLIERERCTIRSGYGAMYVMEMSHPRFRDFDISSLRGGWCVGTPALMQRVMDEMDIPGLVQIYGATEGGGTSGHPAEPREDRAYTCGRPVHGTEFAIQDPETGAFLSAGQTGEILLRGWWTMNGYLKQPEATAKTVDADGWVHTGDLGSLDDKGRLIFASRLKDMLKIGGENVSAEEVESILLGHPKVVQAAVIGAPDDRLSEVVMAIVEAREGETVTSEEIVNFCAQRMANFRVPRYVRLIEEWPLTGSGKIQKHKLRETFLADFRRAS